MEPGLEQTRSKTRRAWRGIAPAVLLAAVASWEIVATLRADADLPAVSEWRAAARALRSRHRPGELITFAPAWLDPVGRSYVGDLLSPEIVGHMDSSSFSTIWELAIRGARAREARPCQAAETQRFGSLVLRRYACQPARVLTDFVAAFAQSGRTEGELEQPVTAELESIHYQAHRCLKLVPRPGEIARVIFEGVALGSQLVGYVGLLDEFPRLRGRSEQGRLTIELEEQTVLEVEATGVWRRFKVPTARRDAARVAFSARSVGPAQPPRLICFAAEAWR